MTLFFNAFQTSPLYKQRAVSGTDFMAARGEIIIGDGETLGQVPVSILPDLYPELPELLTAKLTDVRLVGITPTNPTNLPSLGEKQEATVTIASNDDANGVFRIYSNDPRSVNDGQMVVVEEREQLAVELIVEREGWGELTIINVYLCGIMISAIGSSTVH